MTLFYLNFMRAKWDRFLRRQKIKVKFVKRKDA